MILQVLFASLFQMTCNACICCDGNGGVFVVWFLCMCGLVGFFFFFFFFFPSRLGT